MKEAKNKRDRTIDVIRAIGILCVLIGHSNILPQGTNGSGEWFIALFHVTIFYIASGYVFKETCCQDIRSLVRFILRRIRQLWIPYVLANLFFLLVVDGFDFGTMTGILLMANNAPSCNSTWFLPAIFFISVSYAAIEWMLRHVPLQTDWIQSLLSVVFLYGSYWFKPLLPQRLLWILFGYIMFHLGIEYKRHMRPATGNVRYLCIAALSAFVLWRCCLYQTISIYGNQIVSPMYYMFVSVIGFFFVRSLSCLVCRMLPQITKPVEIIGQSSMFILLFHNQLWIYVLNPVVACIAHRPIDSPDCFSSTPWWGLLYLFLGLLIPAVAYRWMYLPLDAIVFSKRINTQTTSPDTSATAICRPPPAAPAGPPHPANPPSPPESPPCPRDPARP